MKFKKGDIVTITTDRCEHHLQINTKATVLVCDPLSWILRYLIEDANGNSMWVSENEIA